MLMSVVSGGIFSYFASGNNSGNITSNDTNINRDRDSNVNINDILNENELLRKEIQRLNILLNESNLEKLRLKNELNLIHKNNGTYELIEHLRIDVQRLKLSKLSLIASTSNELNRLRHESMY